jgi:hypothetical protein
MTSATITNAISAAHQRANLLIGTVRIARNRQGSDSTLLASHSIRGMPISVELHVTAITSDGSECAPRTRRMSAAINGAATEATATITMLTTMRDIVQDGPSEVVESEFTATPLPSEASLWWTRWNTAA